MSRLVFDIESNGFLEKLTTIHCINTRDIDTGELGSYRSDVVGSIQAGLQVLEDAEEIIGHNIIDFDIPAIQKVYPKFKPRGKVTDTLILSRLIYPHLKDKDFTKRPKFLPQYLYGSHGLEAWGYRLGYNKGSYAKMMKDKGLDPWAEVNDDMVDYCDIDVELNYRLLKMFGLSGFSRQSFDLEHDIHYICKDQMAHGCSFDLKGAQELYLKVNKERWKIEERMKEVFGSWWVGEEFTPKRPNKTVGYLKDTPLTKLKLVEFNPASRAHIAKRLTDLRGWKPTVFTPSGLPQVDETTIKPLNYPEAPLLLRYLMLNKRVGQIAEGKNAWLKLVKDDGRIYGRIKPNEAITSRATHSKPNLAQVPAGRSPFGTDCRALFRATPGLDFVGADASGLELRLFAHYLSFYDGGAYAKVVLGGEIHTVNQKAAGLATRDLAKTFIYALLYGAGDYTLGGGNKARGRRLRDKFMTAIPAYAKLVEDVQAQAKSGGYVIALDGRKLWVRHDYAALNTLLQGAGAVIMKQAMVNYHRILEEDNVPFDQVLWVHDEFQAECAPEYSNVVGGAMVEGIRMTTTQFKLGCALDGDYKVGVNWAETH